MTYQELKEAIQNAITEFSKTNNATVVSIEAQAAYPVIARAENKNVFEKIEQYSKADVSKFIVTIL